MSRRFSSFVRLGRCDNSSLDNVEVSKVECGYMLSIGVSANTEDIISIDGGRDCVRVGFDDILQLLDPPQDVETLGKCQV